MKRAIFGVLGGVVTGFILIGLIESLAQNVYPPPAGIDYTDKEAVRQLMFNMPMGAYLLILSAYVVGSFFGGAVATLIDKSGKYLPAWIVGGLLLLAGIANLVMLPHPIWFAVISSLCYPLFASAGAFAAKRITGK